MKKSRHSEEKIIAAVKQVEGGRKAAEMAREMGVSEATVYTWKSKYGGMQVSDAKRLRQLKDENRRLKGLVADLSLDKEVMKAIISKNGWSS
jgi:putative transposase